VMMCLHLIWSTSTATCEFTIDVHKIRQILCLFVLRRVSAFLGRVQHKFQELNINFIDFRKPYDKISQTIPRGIFFIHWNHQKIIEY
jgi:hypothetical protein